MKRLSNPKYKVGQHVRGKVEKLLPCGLFVRLADGTQAYIRRRELTWAGNIDPRELWQEGEQIEGIILKLAESGQNMELSHRNTLPDPWGDVNETIQPGDLVEGIVKSLMSYGVYLEIKPGVDGLIPLEELATWPVQKPDDLIWIGDMVEAVVTHIDYRARKLRLSVQARMQQLKVVTGIMENFDLFSKTDMNLTQPDKSPDLPAPVEFVVPKLKQVGPILVIDDYDDIRLPLVEWLRHLGYEVDEAKDAAEARLKVMEKRYELLFVDLNLPEMNGLMLLRQLKQQGLNHQAVIMSTAERLVEYSSEIEAIGVIEAFVKPLNLDEIEQLLSKIEQGENLPPWQMRANPAPKHSSRSSRETKSTAGKVSLTKQFRMGLEHLIATTPAETAIIFRLDPISRTISITACAGKRALNEEAIHNLGASPVRDVIEEGMQILENQMAGQTRESFRKLLELLPFESCIGVPVEVGGEIHRALFLFQRKVQAFNRYHLRDAVAASALFSAAIERQTMEQRFRSLNKLLLAGQLAGGFSHEVYNKISGLEIQLRNLQIDSQLDGRPQTTLPEEIGQAIARVQLTFNDLKDTVELFQQLMRAEGEHELNVNETVQRSIALLRPIIREHKVKIETELCPELPTTCGNAVQLQQVILNIMLNAIQQMTLKPDCGKVMTISTTYQASHGGLPIQVRFSDAGPGIHRRLWERVFDLGFTTRLGGTGQGLYIARSLVEALDGKISVERSVVPLGTTFLVELPELLL